MLDGDRIFRLAPTSVRCSIARFQDSLAKPSAHTSSDGGFESSVSNHRSDVILVLGDKYQSAMHVGRGEKGPLALFSRAFQGLSGKMPQHITIVDAEKAVFFGSQHFLGLEGGKESSRLTFTFFSGCRNSTFPSRISKRI